MNEALDFLFHQVHLLGEVRRDCELQIQERRDELGVRVEPYMYMWQILITFLSH